MPKILILKKSKFLFLLIKKKPFHDIFSNLYLYMYGENVWENSINSEKKLNKHETF